MWTNTILYSWPKDACKKNHHNKQELILAQARVKVSKQGGLNTDWVGNATNDFPPPQLIPSSSHPSIPSPQSTLSLSRLPLNRPLHPRTPQLIPSSSHPSTPLHTSPSVDPFTIPTPSLVIFLGTAA